MSQTSTQRFLQAFEAETRTDVSLSDVEYVGHGALPSIFAVTDFASASIACAARAADRLSRQLGGEPQHVVVDRRLASYWFRWTLAPDGWAPAPPWDAIAGDYRASDGWIRLHTNAPHHRAAALSVLGCRPDRDSVAAHVATAVVEELEAGVVDAGGCAAAMRSEAEWSAHPQGAAVAAEPIVHVDPGSAGPAGPGAERGGRGTAVRIAEPGRPLRGVRVLDLTRILAGPIATRFLAGLGADVLRIDPFGWEEPAVAAEVTLGKRCGRLDLRDDGDRSRFRRLLAGADVIVHGYRPGALDGLGLSAEERQVIAPGLVDVSLGAYGSTGPWHDRRGFDSLVQMSTGIADSGMRRTGGDRPTPLPVQALDHATGYLMAACALHGWCDRLSTGVGSVRRVSLARTAAALCAGPRTDPATDLAPVTEADQHAEIEHTTWGPARRLLPPVRLPASPLHWDRPATDLGTEPAPLAWLDSFDGEDGGTQ